MLYYGDFNISVKLNLELDIKWNKVLSLSLLLLCLERSKIYQLLLLLSPGQGRGWSVPSTGQLTVAELQHSEYNIRQ